ncbi:tigger transposable element-derived protein 3 [Ascaphus truei]|uniref:tigger transposable element-derived protein 3 n=1 Tax=Ascaphus truei TaxID=8439 RepID=UPI003F59446A
MEPSGKKKLHALSLAEKIRVLEMLDESKMSQSEVARIFLVSQPQISRICKNKEKLLADWCSGTANRQRKRKRESKYSGIDEALLCWFHIARTKMWDITGPMLLQKAKELADIMGQEFIPSIGWLVRWKRRNNVCFGPRHRPSFSDEVLCDDTPAVDLPQALKEFSSEDVYGCREVSLFYKTMQPGRRDGVERVGVFLCACVGGEKRRALVVGRQSSHHCFFGVHGDSLPALYRSSQDGHMTPEIFSEWLSGFDHEMESCGRTVALLLDREVAQFNVVLNNVKLVYLPPNVRLITPLHPEIVRAFKYHYKSRLLGKVSALKSERDCSEFSTANGLTLLDAVHMVAASWEKVSPSTIQRCFEELLKTPGNRALARTDLPLPAGMSPEKFRRFVDLEEESVFHLPEECSSCKEEDMDGSPPQDLMDGLPTKADALKALGTLRRWFECNGSSENVFRRFYECEEEVERLCCQ